MTQTKNIAIIGYGNVGRGFYELYNKLSDPGFRVSAIAERHPEKLPGELRSLFRLAAEVVHDPDIDLVVEVTNNADEAFTLVEEALREGKKVVSANKKMLARNLKTLEPFIRQGRLRFEAAACASIPVFRIIDGFYSQEPLTRIRGVFNGTCNYLLSRMAGEGRALPELIADAQALGFAEADPTDDVEGHDTLYKLILLAYSAWGQVLSPATVQRGGISGVKPADVKAAAVKGQALEVRPDRSIRCVAARKIQVLRSLEVGEVEVEVIVPGTAIDGVRTLATGDVDVIVPGSGIDAVRPRVAVEGVGVVTPDQAVVALPALQVIAAREPDQRVIARLAVEVVVLRGTGE